MRNKYIKIIIGLLTVALVIAGIIGGFAISLSINNQNLTKHFTQVRDSLGLPSSLVYEGPTTQYGGIDTPQSIIFGYTFSGDAASLHQQLKDLLEKDGYSIIGNDQSTPGRPIGGVDWYVIGKKSNPAGSVYIQATGSHLVVQISNQPL
jgi:hypothetical protein